MKNKVSEKIKIIRKIIDSIDFLTDFSFWSEDTRKELSYIRDIFEEVLEYGEEEE